MTSRYNNKQLKEKTKDVNEGSWSIRQINENISWKLHIDLIQSKI